MPIWGVFEPNVQTHPKSFFIFLPPFIPTSYLNLSIVASLLKFILKIAFWSAITFIIISSLSVVAYRWLPVKVTPLMYIRSFEHRGDSTFADWKHEWVDLEDMSPYMPVAVIASEDQNFRKHKGFDWTAIEKAQQEYEEGGRRRGASTISQQTAKNVFLWPSSSWIRKGFETYFTFLIELIWTKERIMEVYLNSIEMGPGIYGVEAVAQEHFHKSAADLSRSECALIAATLPNPIKFNSASPSRYMRRRQQQIKVQMRHIPLFIEKKGKKTKGK